MSKFTSIIFGMMCMSCSLYSMLPSIINRIDSGGAPSFGVIDSTNHYYYLPNGSDFQVYDISEVTQAVEVHSLPLTGTGPIVMNTDESYVFTLAGATRDTVSAINITNPSAASLTDSETLSMFEGQDIAIATASSSSIDYLYVNGVKNSGALLGAVPHVSGLNIFDVSDPSNISLEHAVQFNAGESNIVIDSNNKFLYLLDDDSNLLVIDISDPLTAQIIKTVPLSGEPNSPGQGIIRINPSNTYLYVLDLLNDNLCVIDILSPSEASVVNDLPGADFSDMILDSNGAFMYISSAVNDFVLILSLENPSRPTGVGEPLTGIVGAENLAIDPGNATLSVKGTHPGSGNSAVYLADISNPFNAEPIVAIDLGSSTSVDQILFDSNGVYSYVPGKDDGDVFVIFNSTLPPVANLKCNQRISKSGFSTEVVNVIEWSPPDVQGVFYIIIRNGIPLACAPANALEYVDRNRRKGIEDDYEIQGVNCEGQLTSRAKAQMNR